MFRECWLPYLFLLLWGETTVRWLPSKKSEASFLFQKTQNHDQSCCCNEEKNEPVCYSGKFKSETNQFSLRKILFCHQAPIPRFTKTYFPAVSELHKDTPMTRCTIPLEKMSGRSVLWLLTTKPVVTLVRWNCTVRWLISRKWQAACRFQKTQKLLLEWGDKWISVFFWQVWWWNYPAFATGKNFLCYQAPMPRLTKYMFLCIFRVVKTHLGNTVLFHDKTRQRTVFFETWLPYLLLLWLSEPELSNDFPARSVKQPVSFRKFKDLAKAAVVNKRKMNQWGFLAGLHSCFVTQSYLTLVTPWTAACQVSLSFTISWSLLKLMSIESVMPSNHLILYHPLLLLPLIFPSIRVFSNMSALHIRWLT